MFVSSIFVFMLCGALISNIQAYKTYSKHQLWRLHVNNNEQVAKILEFRRIAHVHDINFWSDEFRMNIPVSLSLIEIDLFLVIRSMFVYHQKQSKVLENIFHRRRITFPTMLL